MSSDGPSHDDDDGAIEELDDAETPSVRALRWGRREWLIPALVLAFLISVGAVTLAGMWPSGRPTSTGLADATSSASPSPSETGALTASPAQTSAPPTATPGATPSELPTPKPTPVPLTLARGWTANTFGSAPAPDHGDYVSFIGMLGGSLVAVGNSTEGAVVRIWERQGNASWQELSSFASRPQDGGMFEPRGMAAAEDTIVLAGDGSAIDFSLPEIWYRLGKAAWTRATIDTECGHLSGVVHLPSGFLAFGATCGQLPGGPPASIETLLYSSTDGRVWTRRSVVLPGHVSPSDLEWDGSRLVGVGSGDQTLPAASLISTDGGKTWGTHELSGSGPYRFAQRILRTPGGYLAIGSDATSSPLEPRAIVWSSSDGASWQVVMHGAMGTSPSGIVEAAGGFLMVGDHPSDTGSPYLVIWSSTDGHRWGEAQVIASGGTFLAVGLAVVDNAVVVVANRSAETAFFPSNQPLAILHRVPIP